ncbi:MAG: non-homologous end-joining DNA ligase [Firmicutes bacterium]|nr:non-homologous end-joining DNA ligase [Bacillota bacterium]
MEITVDGERFALKNLDKVYFPAEGYLKADVIDYYIRIAPVLLPHLRSRPFSMIFFPGGKVEDSFYQKQRPQDAPAFVGSVRIPSGKRGHIDWCSVDNVPALIYLVNKSVLEMHAWFSRAGSLDCPDIAVLDLDPSGGTGIREAAAVAVLFRGLLEGMRLYCVPKTSGSRGIHIWIPIIPRYTYGEVRDFLSALCRTAIAMRPDLCTTERTVRLRGDKIYLDAVQCAWGKTLAMPYSLRCKSGACVSVPLRWDEVCDGLDPKRFNLKTMFARLDAVGDLMDGFYDRAQELPKSGCCLR